MKKPAKRRILSGIVVLFSIITVLFLVGCETDPDNGGGKKPVEKVYTATKGATTNGNFTINSSNSPVESEAGETINLRATPSQYYQVKEWTFDPSTGIAPPQPGGTNNTWTFIMPAFDVTVTAVFEAMPIKLTGISVSGPTNRNYVVGQTLDLTGLIVTAQYTGQASKAVTTYTKDYEDAVVLDEVKTFSINISYMEDGVTVTGKTADITVEALRKTGLIIMTPPTKVEYLVGESFDPTGMVVKAIWNNGEETAIDNVLLEFEFNENRDMVIVTDDDGATVLLALRKLEDLAVKNFGSYDGGNTETGTGATGGFPFWAPEGWARIGVGDVRFGTDPTAPRTEFAEEHQAGVEYDESTGELKFTYETAGWNPAFFLDITGGGEEYQSSQLLTGYDAIFTRAASVRDGEEFQYSFMIKATGDFNFLFWNTTNVDKDFTGGSAGYRFRYLAEEGEFRLDTRPPGTTGKLSDKFTSYTLGEWNRIDIITIREGGPAQNEGMVTVKIYVNKFRVVWEETTNHQYSSFVNGNYFGGTWVNSNHGPRFCVVPGQGTEVFLKKVAE